MKDTITNICGLIVAVGGSLLVLDIQGTVKVYIGVAVAVATGVIGFYTGKTPKQ
jgi:NAD kinase